MTRRAICFDLDGTLVDSLGDIINAFRAAIAEQGFPPPAAHVVRPLVGLPLHDVFAALAPEGDADVMSEAYKRIHRQTFTETSTPFPEVVEVLTVLRDKGFALAVTTTKDTPMARELVTALGLLPHLDLVQGTDGFPAKPAPDVVDHALRAISAEGTWMVGDTTHDIGAGQAAGLRTYAVCRPEGTHDRLMIEAAGPDHLEESLLPLLDLV
ncbi:HAD family hydrolase [Janibacter anophelis]|uniref:HAD family hydrolase n=1 Tax=Janibacter anophelis TaxID=319054 RepID=UPI000AA4C856|nr:HAD family hydrolase [Janibacter anophelis]